MSNLKILATIVGLTTAVILITQLSNNGSAEPLVEHWNAGGPLLAPLQETTYTCNKTGKNVKDPRLSGRKLTGVFPESVFFGNAQLQPQTVIGATNMEASPYSVGNGGSQIQYKLNANPTTTPAALFSNFAEAAGVVEENYTARSSSAPPIESCNRRSDGLSNPAGCGPRGTISDGYGLQRANALGPDYSPMNSEPLPLPISHMDAYSIPQGNLETVDEAGHINSHFMTSSLMYSTLRRARCPGTTDMIRGDLPVVPGPTCGQSAARPGDSLEPGAFAAMFGSYSVTPQATTALISADSGSVRTALGGVDQVNEVMQGVPEPVLTMDTFIPTSAISASRNFAASQKSVATDTLNGNVQGRTGALITGYTSY